MELPPPPDPGAVDAARAARLAALSTRRPSPTPTGATGRSPARPGAGEAAPTRRRHPARGARVAALGLSLASTGGLAALFAVLNPSGPADIGSAAVVSASATAVSVVPRPVPNRVSTSTVPTGATPGVAGPIPDTTASSATTVPATTVPATTVPATTVVDGAVFHNKWGDVQVEATFTSDGRLVDVAALRTPDSRSQSVQINRAAVPSLTAEALRAQSAQVDTVSGATYTSNDYRHSLQSAIDAAVQAGLPLATA